MKYFVIILALTFAFPLQEELSDLAFEILKAEPNTHDIAMIVVGFVNNVFYNDKDFKASKCLEGINETISEVEKIIVNWSTDFSFIIKVVTEMALKLSPIINNCKDGWTEVESVATRMFGIIENFEAFTNKIMKNLFGLIGMMGIEIQAAKSALEAKDFYRFGGDMGELFYQVVLKNC
jgi:hypothetical protein